MYRTLKISVKHDDKLYCYFDRMTKAANNLRNTALYRVRQVLTLFEKSENEWTENERTVYEELLHTLPVMGSRYSMPEKGKTFLSYYFLDAWMKASSNQDYYSSDLPRQSAQEILKSVSGSMKGFYASIRKYRKEPNSFTGKPSLPSYGKPGSNHNVSISNQDCVIYHKEDGKNELKFPLTKERMNLGEAEIRGKLKLVTVTPFHGIFIVAITFDDGITCPEKPESQRVISIDFGTNNIAAIANNIGKPCLLFKGGAVKAINQWYNKKMAEMVSKQTRGTTDKFIPTRKSEKLCIWRENHISDFLNKTAVEILQYCEKWDIDTIVIGCSKQQKTGINIGHANNQNFVQIPFFRLKQLIKYRAERIGIRVIEQEESYTSVSSFIDRDMLPVYGTSEKEESYVFSGRRITRGLYKTKTGMLINADLNGAANIMRKWCTDIFERTTFPDFTAVEVINYPCCKCK